MKAWRAALLAKGKCPNCINRPIVEGKSACESCLKSIAKAVRAWRKRNKAKHNAYMRAYMQRRRASQAAPVEGASPSPMGTRDALLARLEALRGQS